MSDTLPRIAVLEEIASSTKAALERIDRRLERVETQLDGIEYRFNARFDGLSSDQRSDFRWLLGMTIGWSAALLGVIARGFHWI